MIERIQDRLQKAVEVPRPSGPDEVWLVMVTNEPFAEEPDNPSLTGYFAYATPEDADAALRATLAGYGINPPRPGGRSDWRRCLRWGRHDFRPICHLPSAPAAHPQVGAYMETPVVRQAGRCRSVVYE